MIYAHNLDADLQSCYAWARHAHDANAVLRGRLDGLDGANLVCGGCGIDIATE